MKRNLLLLFLLSSFSVFGQVYLDEFDNGVEEFTYANMGYTTMEADGEWTITGDGTSGAFEIFGYAPFDENGMQITVDVTGNNKIYLKAKASNLGTSLRMDLKDADGFSTTLPGLTKSLVNDYVVFEFDFAGQYSDGGYGGTACTSNPPCPVDGTRIAEFQFYANPGQGNFAGQIKIDFLSVGTDPGSGPMSSVHQNHFEDDSTINFLGSASAGLMNVIEESQWKIIGNGTNGMWEPVNYLIHNTATLEESDVDMEPANDKVYVRARASVPGTAFRIDLQDINDMVTTAGSITKILTDEFVTYEYNYAGSYQDLAFGGTGCPMGGDPCDVDASRISNMILFVNPGVEAFSGEVHVEYISFGTPLEVDTSGPGSIVYGDHFSGDDLFISTAGAYDIEVNESNLKVTGDGTDVPFSSISYVLHNDTSSTPVSIDMTGNNKAYIRVKSSAPNTLLRFDVLDTAGYTTSLPSFTRLITDEYVTYEIDFASSYVDAGYGGSACEEGTGPCPVDGTAIGQILLYPNPADGAFDGVLDIDFISFGTPLGEDILPYQDHFDDGDRTNISDGGGFTIAEEGSDMVITGDGTAGQYTSFNYTLHNGNGPVLANLTKNNKLYIKAKSSSDVPLRIDLMDQGGYATTNPSVSRTIGTEFSILEYDFTDTYMDGGFGGTSCDMADAPCPVNGAVISNLLIYVDPDNGGFNGTVTIDWLSTIDPLETINSGPIGIDDYADEFGSENLDFINASDGLTASEDGGVITITGDGTAGQFAPTAFKLHEGVDTVLVNAKANDDKLFVRLKASSNDLPVRIDVEDNLGFASTSGGVTQLVSDSYSIIEYDFSGAYLDGGFGGTACNVGPCPVDDERISALQIYINPSVAGFDGSVDIDWISFGEPLMVNVIDENLVNTAKIFPNPVLSEAYLQFNALVNGKVQVEVLDLMGRSAMLKDFGQISTGEFNGKLELENLSKGIHILRFFIDGRLAFTSKFVKE